MLSENNFTNMLKEVKQSMEKIMTIKKQYLEIISLLESNSDKKVKSVLAEIKALCESKTMSKTHLRDENGDVRAIFCYYHKQWELIDDVEYGSKKSSTTGLNTMCKIGVKGWTKTQKLMKDLDSEILAKVMNDEIDAAEIKEIKAARIETIREQVAIECKQESFVTTTELEEMQLS